MKLTDEQIKRAHDVWLDAVKFPPEEMGPTAEAVIRAMAPHLQIPWDEPLQEELPRLAVDAGWRFDWGDGSEVSRVHRVLCRFVQVRNAALPPKPVDLRREKIYSVLLSHPDGLAHAGPKCDKLIEAILVALDEVTK